MSPRLIILGEGVGVERPLGAAAEPAVAGLALLAVFITIAHKKYNYESMAFGCACVPGRLCAVPLTGCLVMLCVCCLCMFRLWCWEIGRAHV